MPSMYIYCWQRASKSGISTKIEQQKQNWPRTKYINMLEAFRQMYTFSKPYMLSQKS